MAELEVCLGAVLVAGLLLGGYAVWQVRAEDRVSWGRVLFVAVLVLLGAGNLVAAFYRAAMLAPLGLAAGSLLAALLWERADTRRQQS